jgi:hypothetical protein
MFHHFSMVKTPGFPHFFPTKTALPGGRARLGRGGAAVAAALGGDPADATAEPQAAEAGWKGMERVETCRNHHGRTVV